MDTIVELEGVNGERFTLAGPKAGDRGIHLGTGTQGLYDPPVKTVWEEPANFPGARFLDHRILRRDIVFGVEILNDEYLGKSKSWMSRDSEWRKAWSYTEDCKLYVTTEDGTRWLNLRLGEQPEVDLTIDPKRKTMHRAVMTCVAGDPFWYSEDETFTYETKTDTTGIASPVDANGNIVPGAEQFTLHVPEANPTDWIVWPMWELSAPGRWLVPDYSFQDDELANRRILMPSLIAGENVEIEVNPMEPQVVAENGAPVWARMNGVRFRHWIPEYTYEVDFNLAVAGAPKGAVCQLRLARPWSRPWGLM